MSKADREKKVFENFSNVAAINILPGTIESRPPPEPDILCQLENSDHVAFELTELIDQDFMARLSLMFTTRQYLNAYWQNSLEHADTDLFCEKYSDALVNFQFDQEASLKVRKAVAKKVFPRLLELPNNFEGEFLKSDSELMRALNWVQICRVGAAEPIIDVSSSGCLGDPTADAIRKKFAKTYETEHPIELLAHINLGIMLLE